MGGFGEAIVKGAFRDHVSGQFVPVNDRRGEVVFGEGRLSSRSLLSVTGFWSSCWVCRNCLLRALASASFLTAPIRLLYYDHGALRARKISSSRPGTRIWKSRSLGFSDFRRSTISRVWVSDDSLMGGLLLPRRILGAERVHV